MQADWMDLAKGTPQGSKLGPSLFNLFINNLLYTLPEDSVVTFADDNTLYAMHSSPRGLRDMCLPVKLYCKGSSSNSYVFYNPFGESISWEPPTHSFQIPWNIRSPLEGDIYVMKLPPMLNHTDWLTMFDNCSCIIIKDLGSFPHKSAHRKIIS